MRPKRGAVQRGPRWNAHMDLMRKEWHQGGHVLVSGGTGSGKSVLARELYELRIRNGGFAVVFYCKLKDDHTFLDEYRGWKVWDKMKKHPRKNERRIILKVNGKGLTPREILEKQRDVYRDALDTIASVGHWTVGYDEGLYFTEPQFLNLGHDMAMQLALGRSSGVTNIVLTQRPAFLPLLMYGSASYVYTAMTKERVDQERLARLSATESSVELMDRISALHEHEFLWTPARAQTPSEVVNVAT